MEHILTQSWFNAARLGDLQTLRRLYATAPEYASCTDAGGNSALHVACAHGHMQSIRFLCGIRPAALSLQNNDGLTAEQCALRARHGGCATYMQHVCRAFVIAQRLKTYENTYPDASPIERAAMHGDMEAAEYLLEKTSGLTESDAVLCMHAAAAAGHTRFMLWIRERHPAALICRDDGGRTSAHTALANGREKTVRLLARYAPEMLSAEDGCGRTVAQAAAVKDDMRLARFLHGRAAHHAFKTRLQEYARTAAADPQRHILDIAAEAGDEKAVRLILSRYPDMPAYARAAERALNAAGARGHTRIVALLLQKFPRLIMYLEQDGAPARLAAASECGDCLRLFVSRAPLCLRTADTYGFTALHEAARAGRAAQAAFILKQRDTYALAVNRFGATPAHTAAYHGRTEILELFSSAVPAALTQRDHDQWNAGDYAAERGHDACVALAEKAGAAPTSDAAKKMTRLTVRRSS